jgi:hypothetical protein
MEPFTTKTEAFTRKSEAFTRFFEQTALAANPATHCICTQLRCFRRFHKVDFTIFLQKFPVRVTKTPLEKLKMPKHLQRSGEQIIIGDVVIFYAERAI